MHANGLAIIRWVIKRRSVFMRKTSELMAIWDVNPIAAMSFVGVKFFIAVGKKEGEFLSVSIR